MGNSYEGDKRRLTYMSMQYAAQIKIKLLNYGQQVVWFPKEREAYDVW